MYSWGGRLGTLAALLLKLLPIMEMLCREVKKLLLTLIIMIFIIYQLLPTASEEDLDGADPDADPVIEQQTCEKQGPEPQESP